MRKLLLSSVLLLSLPAAAWESVCYEQKDTSKEPGEYPRGSGTYCAPAAGPNTARQRWVGTSAASYDTSAEPLCHYLSAGPYLYQPGPGTPEALARTWCGCP